MKIKNLKLKISQYNPSKIEAKWQAVWEKEKIYSPNLDASASPSAKKPFGKAQGKPFYNLMMFPYPSAEGMHVGNMYAFTGADVYGRFQRMQGLCVFEPIGLDGFGIHSENYAIKQGVHPAEQAKISEKNYYQQLHAIGGSFDWTRTVETYKPEYYKWTQWLFIQLFKAGLAYRKKAPVNFCPSCKTVLADEQVLDGKCERCESEVAKKELEQWFFKITKYADRLLNGLTQIDWSEKVKTAQRQWIGRSEGMIINFGGIDVFTTRPETADGATFLVLSPQHPIVASILNSKLILRQTQDQNSKLMEIKDYVKNTKKKTGLPAEARAKEGVFSGEYAINPLTKKEIPIWIADYVLMSYGTGAIMAVPAEDKRDREFAEKYKIPIVKTSFSAKPIGKKVVNYHLRDWLISRQRYWGPPIPMIFCSSCAAKGESGIMNQESRGERNHNSLFMIHDSMSGWFPVPEKDLPVELPFIKDYKPLGTGVAPLASHPEFYKTKCPKCGGEAKRETDVSDTFLDSSWYFLRYLATDYEDIPFPMENSKFEAPNSKQYQNSNIQNSKQFRISDFRPERSRRVGFRAFAQRAAWLPVDMYIGGAEHSVLHLLYSRFITMVLKDLGFVNFEEPFTKFRINGLIVKDGVKMSKSKGNVVIPDQYIKKFGADTLRTYLMFIGPFSQGGDFRDTGIEGMFKFLKRVWNLVASKIVLKEGKVDIYLQKLTAEITEEIENLRYNTVISRLMMYYNFLVKKNVGGHQIFKSEIINFIKMIAPFAPHLAEEIWELLGQKLSVHFQTWPNVDKEGLKNSYGFTIAIQINGKTRATLDSEISLSKEEAERRSKIMVEKYLKGKKVLKVIYVERKVVNFVAV